MIARKDIRAGAITVHDACASAFRITFGVVALAATCVSPIVLAQEPGRDRSTAADRDPDEGARVVPVKARPKWIGLRRCTHDGTIYASGSVSGVQSLDLARSVAADRARRALLPASKAKRSDVETLRGSQVIDVFVVKGRAHALARLRDPPELLGQAPKCDPRRITSRSAVKKNCPDWTRRVAWIAGRELWAVGTVKTGNPSLGEAVAANRARAELVRLVSLDLRTAGEGESASEAVRSLPPGYAEFSRERALCDGLVYVKVGANDSGASPRSDL